MIICNARGWSRRKFNKHARPGLCIWPHQQPDQHGDDGWHADAVDVPKPKFFPPPVEIVGNVLAVASWGNGKTVIMTIQINPDGSLSGKWLRRTDRGTKGTETWKKV